MKLLSLPTKQFRTHHLFSKIRWRRKLLLVRGRLVVAVVVMLIMYFGTGSTKARTKYPWLGDEHVIVVREFNTARPDLNLEPRNCSNESNQTVPCETPQQGIPQNAGEDNAGENPPLPVEKIQEEHTRPPLIYEKYAKPTPAAPLSWIKKVPMEDTMRHDITIVTGYVNIGNFKNDLDKSTHTPGLYRKWLRHFEMIETPVVAYFTDDEDVNIFKKIRQGKSTYIVKVSKEGLWAFSLLDDIAKIYRQYSYPKHNPYTTVPEYTSAMHAKYEFMAKALKENPFKTNFFCWMDVGLFRNVTEPFQPAQTLDLKLPALFDEKRVAYSQINERKDLTVEQIFHNNMVWVCGCIFMAKGTIMKKWIYEYMRYIDKFLMEGIINTDQQVLYGMYMSREERLVDIQVYPWHGQYHQWFENGYMCEDKPGHWVKCLTLN